MANPKTKPATYADIEALPENITGEIIFGVLETHPRPSEVHSIAASSLGGLLNPPFQFGSGGGPGGWLIVDEPEIFLGPHVLVPDIAGWRRQRLGGLSYKTISPDWVCEILSPSTSKRDRNDKSRIYATYNVGHLWLLDPVDRLLEVYLLQGEGWFRSQVFQDQEDVCAPPFDAITFSLGLLWPFDTPSSSKEA